MRTQRFFITLLLAAIPELTVTAGIIHVPADCGNIQDGIDAAVDGDTVLVEDGIYFVGPSAISFRGKAVTVASVNGPENCIVDAQLNGLGFEFTWYEGTDSVLTGFTITGGGILVNGGGIHISGASPTITGNVVTGNYALEGGGIYVLGGAPVIRDNVITENEGLGNAGGIGLINTEAVVTGNVISGNISGDSYADLGGGGIYIAGGSPIISDNVITLNSATVGGGMQIRISQVTLANNLVRHNSVTNAGGGIHASESTCVLDGITVAENMSQGEAGGLYAVDATLTARNSIFALGWSSSGMGDDIFLTGDAATSSLDIVYSCVLNGQSAVWLEAGATLDWGEGMVSGDPLFSSGPYGLFYLSQTATGHASDSPCVDAGDPAAEMVTGTTRTDHVQDADVLDMGFHYPFLLAGEPIIIAGPGPGPANPPEVRVFPALPFDEPLFVFPAYGASGYGVNVACGAVDADPEPDILTGAGPGAVYGPHVRGFDLDGTPIPGLSFLAYGTNRWGVNITTGNIDDDSFDELITGAGPGPVFGPHVRAFDFDGEPPVAPVAGVSFFAYATPRWGVNVAAGDVDGDGYDEIVTGAGPGAVYGPHVRGWNVDGGSAAAMPDLSFLAYGTNRFGVRVACGDLNGDGIDEILTAPGPSPTFAAHIRGWEYTGSAIEPLEWVNFFAWPPAEGRYGASIFCRADLNGEGSDEIFVGGGPDPNVDAEIHVFDEGGDWDLWFTLRAFPPSHTYGVVMAAAQR